MPNIYLARIILLSGLLANYSAASTEPNYGITNILPYKEGRLLVKTINSFSHDSLATVADIIGATQIRSYSLIPDLRLYEFDENIDIADAMIIFQSSNLVQYVEPDYYYMVASPNDPRFTDQWSLENLGQTGGVVDADINAISMWDTEKGDPNIVIGIIDTGVDNSHSDLASNMWHNVLEIPGNNIDDDENGYIDDIFGCNTITNNGNSMDDNAHGTHVAGIIGAQGNNALGVIGVAPNVTIAACKFLSARGAGMASDAIECLQYFAHLKTRSINPVNIIATNNSWGGVSESIALKEAIKAHDNLGILFISSAGNSARNTDESNYYPAGYELPNIISVAATDNNDRLASFSNYGLRTVHVGAPGAKILSTVLNQQYALLSGTSMAAPHLSGMVAIAASHYQNFDHRQIKNIVIASGTALPSLANKTISGRRIRGADTDGTGVVTCSNQLIQTRLKPLENQITLNLGEQILLSGLHINCDLPAGPFAIYSDDGEQVILEDSGLNGDEIPDDGIYSLLWQPKKAMNYALDFGDGGMVRISVIEFPSNSNDEARNL